MKHKICLSPLILIIPLFISACNIHLRGSIYHKRFFIPSTPGGTELTDVENKEVSSGDSVINIENPINEEISTMIPEEIPKVIVSKTETNGIIYKNKVIKIKTTDPVIPNSVREKISKNEVNTNEIKNYKEKVIFSVLMFIILSSLIGLTLYGIILVIADFYWIYLIIMLGILALLYFLSDLLIKVCWGKKTDRTVSEKYGLRRSFNITAFILTIPVAVLCYYVIKYSLFI